MARHQSTPESTGFKIFLKYVNGVWFEFHEIFMKIMENRFKLSLKLFIKFARKLAHKLRELTPTFISRKFIKFF
jgi:hypothetical protein